MVFPLNRFDTFAGSFSKVQPSLLKENLGHDLDGGNGKKLRNSESLQHDSNAIETKFEQIFF